MTAGSSDEAAKEGEKEEEDDEEEDIEIDVWQNIRGHYGQRPNPQKGQSI